MLHFVMSYMKQKKRKQTIESAQYGLDIIFTGQWYNINYCNDQDWSLFFFEIPEEQMHGH